ALLKSFTPAARGPRLLAGIPVSARQVARLTERVGVERAQARDDKAQKRRRRQLPAQVANTPAVVAAEVDGGRLATRAPGEGPGVQEQGRKGHKVACLCSL